MRYEINKGVKQQLKIKKLVIAGVASLGMVGVAAAPALASTTTDGTVAGAVNVNANQSACFGQARSSYAEGGPSGVLSPNNNGYWISQRQGTNPSNNAGYIVQYC